MHNLKRRDFIGSLICTSIGLSAFSNQTLAEHNPLKQFQQKLMEPIRYRADKIKQNKEMQEQAREMINSVQKFQEENLREEIEMQKQILINMNKKA